MLTKVSGHTPRLLRCAWLLCVEDSKTKYLSAVASSFAVTCASNRKIITAFHNITFPEPNDHTVNYNEPYYVVSRLYPRQTVDDRAVAVAYNGCGDYDRDWAVLDVTTPGFHFTDTLPLRDPTKPLPLSTESSVMLNTLYYKVGLHRTSNPEFMEATATHLTRVDHVYTRSVEMPCGLYGGSSGAPMVDEDECVACIHVDSINQIEFPNSKRIKVADVSSQGSSYHACSRHGSIIFTIPELINNLK